MIKTLTVAAVAVTLVACGAQAPETEVEAATGTAEAPAESPELLGVFTGVLPCADCPGIETKLTLTRKGPGWGDGTFELVETYLERGEPVVTTGEWGTLRGSATDPDATVYELNPGQESVRYFRVDGENLRMLDRELGETPADMPYTLTPVETPTS